MKQILLRLLLTLLASYVGLCLIMFIRQRGMIYFPTEATNADPASSNMLQVPGATLQISVRAHQGDKAVIYFGGNAEDVSKTLPSIAATFPDHAIYMMHYRGFGGSSGEPSESALHADALALYQMVSDNHSSIQLLGRSLGSGIAVQLAATREVSRLVLITPFDSLVNVAKAHFPYMPVSLLLRERYESWRFAAKITAPTLILSASDDQIVPRKNTAALLHSFTPGIAVLKELPGVNHNTISSNPKFFPLLRGSDG